jgi:hypothetical protein
MKTGTVVDRLNVPKRYRVPCAVKLEVKYKGKGHLRIGHEGPKGEERYSSTPSLTSALDVGWVVSTMPRSLYPQERPGVHSIGGWVGPRVCLDRYGPAQYIYYYLLTPWSRVPLEKLTSLRS